MNWIIPANEKYYRANKAFKKRQVIYWRQTVNYSIGDIVYLYCTRPYKKIMLKTEVLEIDRLLQDTPDDSEFFVNIPAGSTIELINKYRVHAHPDKYKSYPYKKSIYYTFRAKYGVMDRLFSLERCISIDPNNIKELDNFALSEEAKERVISYIKERKAKYEFSYAENYKFYIFDEELKLPNTVSLPGQNNQSYLKISDVFSGRDIVERTDETIQGYKDEEEQETFLEGSAGRTSVNKYERNKGAREKCLKVYGYKCAVCGFDFEEVYGQAGKGIIDVHHKKPLYEIREEYKVDPVKDLIPLCPNCHRVIHSRKPCYEVDELKLLLKK